MSQKLFGNLLLGRKIKFSAIKPSNGHFEVGGPQPPSRDVGTPSKNVDAASENVKGVYISQVPETHDHWSAWIFKLLFTLYTFIQMYYNKALIALSGKYMNAENPI